jgi:hypothetical protein
MHFIELLYIFEHNKKKFKNHYKKFVINDIFFLYILWDYYTFYHKKFPKEPQKRQVLLRENVCVYASMKTRAWSGVTTTVTRYYYTSEYD